MYNITFEKILRAKNKAANCLSWLVEPILPSTSVNMLTASHTEGHAFNTRSHTQTTSPNTTSTLHPNVLPRISQETNPTPKLFTADRMEAFMQMQRTDLFCKHVSKRLLNGKAPQHEFDTFTHMKGLLYKHVMAWVKNFLPWLSKISWKCTVLVETHNKLGHQGTSFTYCLI